MRVFSLVGPWALLALGFCVAGAGCTPRKQRGETCGIQDRCEEGFVCFDGDRSDHVCVALTVARAECPKSNRCAQHKFCRVSQNSDSGKGDTGYHTCVK